MRFPAVAREVLAVPLDAQGYDETGAYWGVESPKDGTCKTRISERDKAMVEHVIDDTRFHKSKDGHKCDTCVHWPAAKRTLHVATTKHSHGGVVTRCHVSHMDNGFDVYKIFSDFSRELLRKPLVATAKAVEAQHLSVVDDKLASLIAEVEAFYAGRPGTTLSDKQLGVLTAE